MRKVSTPSKQKRPVTLTEAAICLGLFLLALLPRAYDLQRFVTADEAKWVYRSAQFLSALLQGDLAATNVNLTPAVTTTWLGSAGLTLHYQANQAAIGLPFIEWLRSLPEFRTELPILAATRWPMVVFTSLGVVLLYLTARRLFHLPVALLGAAFIALDPHTVALSRILGHDAPTAVLMPLALLLLLIAVRESGLRWLVLAGIAAGLAFLSKAPALFLIPFAALIFGVKIWTDETRRFGWFRRLLVWGAAAYLTFVIAWPAAWVDPAGQPMAVVENAFLSATDQEEADSENHWLVPDLGPLYYLVNGGFKLSPLVMAGAGLTAIFFFASNRPSKWKGLISPEQSPLFWLAMFVLLFTIFMTLSEKRSPRYILPAFPPLAFIAALGWLRLSATVAGQRGRDLRLTIDDLRLTIDDLRFGIVLVLCALAVLLPYAPYYFTYYNPLLGGPFTAPQWVKIGWGEGLDQVGRFLEREAPGSRVGAPYASTVAPFFNGSLSSVTGDRLAYVVLYSKQVQSGEPAPEYIRYYEQEGPLFSVALNGIDYAGVYLGPAVQPSLPAQAGPAPIGYRPLTVYGAIGEQLEVDLLWPAAEPLAESPTSVTLRASTEEQQQAALGTAGGAVAGANVLAEGSAAPTRVTGDLVVSRHTLNLPDDLARGPYALFADDQPLGEIELRRFRTPPDMRPVDNVVFEGQIALTGYQFSPTEDFIGVKVAWQAQEAPLPDYTVFVQILDAETNERVAGVDTQPLKGSLPTSRWLPGEVVVDEYLVAAPPDLAPGFYKVIVGLYQPATGERLTLGDGQDYWAIPWTFIRKDRS